MTVTPMILRSLIAQGYPEHLMVAAIAHGIAVSVVVLLIFLFLRKVMAGSGAPPLPADLPRPAAKLTDLREISAYVVAHAPGVVCGVTVRRTIFRSIIAQGHGNLMFAGIAISIAVSVVVLLIFLLLRRAMAGP